MRTNSKNDVGILFDRKFTAKQSGQILSGQISFLCRADMFNTLIARQVALKPNNK